MRLTLRTLLAWLDGVLPQDEQEQLGVKVSSSVVATQLAERIRLAVGRPQIGAPRVDGRGLAEDANSAAEYLDNTLESEKLEAFERICIDSELHLAEVAACHGLLAEMARTPRAERRFHEDELQRLRQRVRGLLAGLHDRPITEHVGDEHAEARQQMHAIREALTRDVYEPGHPQPRGVSAVEPPERRRASAMAWVSAAAAALLLVILSLSLVWTFLKPSGNPGAAKRSGEVAAAGEGMPSADPDPAPAAVDPPGADGEPALAGGDSEGDGRPAPGAEAARVVDPSAAPPVAQTPESGGDPAMERSVAGPAAATQPDAPGNPVGAGSAPEPAAGGGPPVGPPEAPAAAADAAQPLGFVGGEGLLLRVVPGQDSEWTLCPAGSQLARREDLLVPPASHPEIHVRGVLIRLLPQTRVVLSDDADGTPRIEVVFGRAVARASRPDVRLGVSAGGLVGRIEGGLLDPAAIEVVLRRPIGDDPATATPQVLATVIAASRGLSWRQTESDGTPATEPLEGIGAEGLLDAGMMLEWNSAVPSRIAVLRDRGLPNWIGSSVRPDRLEQDAVKEIADRARGDVPLVLALREMAAHKRVENRMLAAETLAIIGEFDELVEQLAADSSARRLTQQQWMQLEGSTVPLALSRGGDQAERLYRAFVARGPHGKADVLWAMARGITDAELAAGADRSLVEALDDPDLIVRRFAYKQLLDITQSGAVDRTRYRPDGQLDMRRDALAWWRGQVERGLVRRAGAAPGR